MSVYVVRLQRDEQVSPCLVGIYLAGSVEELERQIEDCCSKYLCEFAQVQHRSIYAPDLDGAPETRLYAEPNEPAVRSTNELSEDWRELFSEGAPLLWRRFGEARWRSAQERYQAFASARQFLKAA